MPLDLEFHPKGKVRVVVSDQLIQTVIFVEIFPGGKAVEVFEQESSRLFAFLVGYMTDAAGLESL